MTNEILERRRKFVAALRSGEFSQGNLTLRQTSRGAGPDLFCCLGVACEVFRRETGKGEWGSTKFSINKFVVSYVDSDYSSQAMPISVAEWLGHYDSETQEPVSNPDLYIPDLMLNSTMIAANDTYGRTFAQIADMYEAQYITPFENFIEENDDAGN